VVEEEEEDLHLEALMALVVVEEEEEEVEEVEEAVVAHQQQFKFLMIALDLLLVEEAKPSKCCRIELEQGFRCPKKVQMAFALCRYRLHRVIRSSMLIERFNYFYRKNPENHLLVHLVDLEEEEEGEEEPHGVDLIEVLVVVLEEEDLIKH
jgi:hypothetical protein